MRAPEAEARNRPPTRRRRAEPPYLAQAWPGAARAGPAFVHLILLSTPTAVIAVSAGPGRCLMQLVRLRLRRGIRIALAACIGRGGAQRRICRRALRR